MEVLTDILPIVISLFAVAIPFIAAVYSKWAATASITTAHRMEWISTVRESCTAFLNEFAKNEPSTELLKALSVKIQLYGYGSTYDKLFGCLKDCIAFVENTASARDAGQKETLSQNLIAEVQLVLNGVWWRVKREAGISQLADNRINRLYRKRVLPKGKKDNMY